MPVLEDKIQNKMYEVLISALNSNEKLDDITFRRHISMAESIREEDVKLEVLALSHGLYGDHELAMDYFQKAKKFRNERCAINYLVYLNRYGYLELNRKESISLAQDIGTIALCEQARNVAYNSGDSNLTIFFGKKILSMINDDEKRSALENEMNCKISELNDFMEVSGLSSSEVDQFTLLLDKYAREKGMYIESHEFYSNACEDVAAVICEIECDNVEVMADMDIGVATNLAMNNMLLSRNVTAWFTCK